MYLGQKVKIPSEKNGVSVKKIKGVSYVYYAYDRVYNKEKKYTVPKNTTIGKSVPGEEGMMFPNQNYFRYFPDETNLESLLPPSPRCEYLKVGTYFVLKKIISEYHLDEMMERIVGKDSGLFLDLAAYSIICEDNAGQYYPDYAYEHPLFTSQMKVYSDAKVSEFINSMDRNQSIAFLNEWNASHKNKDRLYISYDSTNKNCAAGDIDFVEFGHPKDDKGKPVVNYSIAYDSDNSVPLFYEAYPGSIVDISQLQYMLGKAAEYGYKNAGFILDRGYFSEPNIHFMDRNGYDFIIMMKGCKSLVAELVKKVKGSFEDRRECSIRDYRVSGCTEKGKLFDSDEKERFFHIYYSDYKKSYEKENIQQKIDTMAEILHSHVGKALSAQSGFTKYFELTWSNDEKGNRILESEKERYDVINQEISLCGYYVIITSEEMSAIDALELYKSRDASEKLFRGDKSYLGNRSFRIQSSESMVNKIFIEFVALIIRNRFYRLLKEKMENSARKYNYMTVPAAIKELEKIGMIRPCGDGSYVMHHAVTAVQKEILKAFDMNETKIRKQAQELSALIDSIEKNDKDQCSERSES